MKASDRIPAMMNTSANPLATSGTVESSVRSRMAAINTRASVSPAPAPKAKNIPSQNPYPRFVWKIAR